MTTDLNPPLLPMSRATPFDPPPAYDALRSAGIKRFTWPNGVQAWLVTRHEDVREALRDQRLSVDKTGSPPPSLALGRSSRVMLPRSLVGMDPPEHTRWRGPVMRELTVRRVARLRGRIESIVAAHLDRMERQGPPADLVASFALPIPSLVISELLGVPADDQPRFQRYTQVISTVGAPAEEVHDASAALTRYLGELIGAKRRLPGDDILSHLAMEFPAGDGSAADGVLGNGMLLLIAGHETTANMLALSVVTLLQWPDQLAIARSGTAAMDRAVEELLRFHAVIQYGIVRRAAEDLVLSGQRISVGEWVVCSLAAANRDPGLCADPGGSWPAGSRRRMSRSGTGYTSARASTSPGLSWASRCPRCSPGFPAFASPNRLTSSSSGPTCSCTGCTGCRWSGEVSALRVSADRSRCCGAGLCAALAPEIFTQSDDDGTVIVLDATPPAERSAAVRAAVRRCPSQAIQVLDTPGPVRAQTGARRKERLCAVGTCMPRGGAAPASWRCENERWRCSQPRARRSSGWRPRESPTAISCSGSA